MSFEIYPDSIAGEGGEPQRARENGQKGLSMVPASFLGVPLWGLCGSHVRRGAVNSAEAWLSSQDTSKGTLDIAPDVSGVCPDLEFLLCSLSIWWNLQSV